MDVDELETSQSVPGQKAKKHTTEDTVEDLIAKLEARGKKVVLKDHGENEAENNNNNNNTSTNVSNDKIFSNGSPL